MLSTLKRKINILALSRLGVILLGAALLFWVVQTESFWGVIGVFFAIVLAFAALVYRQSKEEETRQRWEAFLAVNQNEVHLNAGQQGIYDDGADFGDPRHPYTDDLDVFGPQSLYAMVNRCASREGRSTLAGYMRAADTQQRIVDRQHAVKELTSDRDWAQQFQVDLYGGIRQGDQLKAALRHYVADSSSAKSASVGFSTTFKWYVRAAPYLIGACLLMSFWIPVVGRWCIYVLVAHLLAALWYSSKTSLIAGRFEKMGALLKTFTKGLIRIEKREWTSDYLKTLQRDLYMKGSQGNSESDGATPEPASEAIQKLADILGRLDYRLNMLVGAIMNMVFLWDFRQLIALQAWRKRYSSELLEALDVVGEVEALNSLAILTINHPHWCFPEVLPEDEKTLAFQALNHPLIDPKIAVANHYSKENHRIALITGSNMAGKSTFLRTVGTNMVLAFCGAPVCAQAMQVSVMHLITYMRIKDSLQESTSTFKAELDRMRLILDTVRTQPHSFFLIDEMLRGTNSIDKYRGSKAIIERLIQEQAHGMVATHDLQLASLEQSYPGQIRNFHFDIQVRDGEMLFDYKLKDGECKIFNASILLSGIGIEVD